MEQRLEPTFLRAGPMERAAAVGASALGVGLGILLAAWGISFLWRYTPPEISVRIKNPEVHIAQDKPLTVTQERPFAIEQPEPIKVDSAGLTVKVDQQPPASSGVGADTKTSTGDVIRRVVTVFSEVSHGPGTVVTGWNYRDGSGGVPFHQFCYYTAPNFDRSSRKVDIALDRNPAPNLDAGLVPDLDGALAKCQWWRG
jgi:hypothetical protein